MRVLARAFAFFATFQSIAMAGTPPTTESKFAVMEVTYASGLYQSARDGSLTLNYDETGNPISLTLSILGQKYWAQVWQALPGSCGDEIYARFPRNREDVPSDLVLTDYTNARCRLYVKHKWHAVVSAPESDGSESKLLLEGDPRD